jgi:hypothetical protein
VKVVPYPGVLSTAIVPWCCVTIVVTGVRPSPVPFPGAFVVKKGSKDPRSQGSAHADARVADAQDPVRHQSR